MKKSAFFVLAFSLFSTSAFANPFYQDKVGLWDILGLEADGQEVTNNVCFARTKWADGSYFALIQDVKDGEMYIDMSSKAWNISDAAGTTSEMTMYFSGKSGSETSTATFVIVNPNTLRVPQVDIKYFLNLFDKYSNLDIIPSGNVPKLPLSLKGSSAAIGKMVECLEKEKTLESSTRNHKNQYQDSVPKQKTIIDPSKPGQDT